MLSRAEAIADLTSSGSPFELETREINGNPLRVFKNAPTSLRDVWLSAAQRGETPYFHYDDVTTTYGGAHQQVTAVAAWLVERGVKKGDRVAVGMRNYPEWAMATWSSHCSGSVTVSMNAWWISE